MWSQELPPTAQLMPKKLSIAAYSASMDVPDSRTLVSDLQKWREEKKKKKKGCSLGSTWTWGKGCTMKTALGASKHAWQEPVVRLSLALTSLTISWCFRLEFLITVCSKWVEMGSMGLPICQGSSGEGTLLLGSVLPVDIRLWTRWQSHRRYVNGLVLPLSLMSRSANPNRSCAKESPIKEDSNKGLNCKHTWPRSHLKHKEYARSRFLSVC